MFHFALLRGINVGKAKRIAMADLRQLVEQLGGRDVQTLLNSGNVACRLTAAGARDFAPRLEAALTKKLSVSCRVLLLSTAELDEILARNPLPAATAQPSQFLVAVLADAEAERQAAELARQDWSPDEVAPGPRCLYLWCKAGILESKLAVKLLKLVDATSRNWATLTKLRALAGDR